jgi:2-methylcitrate dehydratase PrpD
MSPNWSRVLADFLCDEGPPPARVREQAALVFTDTIAAMAVGAGEDEVARLIARPSPPGPCTIIGSPAGGELRWAAFLNATSGTAAEFDEGNYGAGGHPAVHCLPAVLAGGEAIGASGAQLLGAFVAGYEAAARIGAATRLGPSVHSHGTWGTIAAAVGTARLRGYGPAAMEQAILVAAGLCNASSRTSGLAGASVRSAFAGVAVQNGILACDLVEAGFSGERDAPEIVFGAILGSRFDPEVTCEGLGSVWHIERNFFKPWACCRETHGSLHAFDGLCAENPSFEPEHIAAIRVETFDPASRLTETAALTPLAARYSIPFALAIRITRGRCGPADFRAEAIADPRVRDLAAKVRVVEDKDKTRLLPAQRATSLTLTLADGRIFTSSNDGSPGDAGMALSADQHRAKFLEAARDLWREGAADLYAACRGVEEVAPIHRLTRRFRTALSPAAVA